MLLIYGDNWHVMRCLDSESVDLVCLSPPMHVGKLDDWKTPLSAMFSKECWAWTSDTERQRRVINMLATYNADYEVLKNCLEGFDSLLLYSIEGKMGGMRDLLTFMCPRIVEMNRLLREGGSFYYVGFVFAHYIKCFLDTLFNEVGNNEIDDLKQEIIIEERLPEVYDETRWQNTHRTSLYYTKGTPTTFNSPSDIGSVWKGFGARNPDKDDGIPFRFKSPNDLFDVWVSVSSKPEDIVLDAFCGSGTVLDSAHAQGRRWIGIDNAEDAIQSTIYRMWRKHSLKPVKDYDLIIEENSQLDKITDFRGIRKFLERNELGINFSEMFVE